ncbi:MAG: adenine-specific methyltransferase EcoRI family protein, partial [Lachnospiraceae bacterium]|nr:adenine-specific methyltransferase EcoRI family protein [Lachnospiraceae bacterium]
MAKNSSLNAASVAKQDEFYTQYEDIQNELNHYEKHFKDKIVLCNCDDPFESNFCKFFLRNFNYLGLRRLICTSYISSSVVGTQMSIFDFMDGRPVEKGNGYVMDITEVPMANGRGVSDEDIDKLLKSKKSGVKKLKGDGDFRSEECIEYLKQADIVVTNPPFSLFREYVALLMEYNKKFLIIGNQNNITYKEIFPLIQQNKIWLGCKFGDMAFRVPDYYEPRETRFWIDESGQKWRSFGTICWYTNLDHEKRHEKLVLYKHYYGNEEDYPKYDNYDAINVNKVADIPCDYFENMAVPITYVDKHNPDQFEIVDANEIKTNDSTPVKGHGLIKDKDAVITTYIYNKKYENNAENHLTYIEEPRDTYLTDRQTDRQT